MVARRKVAKKKTAKKASGRKTGSAASKRVTTTAAKKKGVAAKPKPKTTHDSVSLGGSIAISNVQEWYERFVEMISMEDEIILDGGEVEQVDGAGLQLLVALMKEASTSKVKVTWKAASDVLRNSAAQLGVAEILGLAE
jgi:anti-anti-sigma regulatory factor